MRSRKVSPGFWVISMTMRSLSTRVPPVTALRSPPASRMTGADSPVIADSSTLAMPSMMVPSLGITSPASHTTMSPLRRSVAGTGVSLPPTPPCRLRAIVSVRVRRSAWACALPRPSAIASAKFAKSTVNHSQSAICPTKLVSERAPDDVRRRTRTMVITAPISTTNMTGLRAMTSGLSLTKLCPMAGNSSSGSVTLLRRRLG